jgi:hypothetical protein
LVDARGAEAAAGWVSLSSPENYLGYERAADIASSGGALSERRRIYAAPVRLRLNHWVLSGDWSLGRQVARLNESDGRDIIILGLAVGGTSVRFGVMLDGRLPGAAHGDRR